MSTPRRPDEDGDGATGTSSAAAGRDGVVTAPCGDRLRIKGASLVIEAALPIPELEPSKFRAPVLMYEGERFVLVDVSGPAKRPVYRLTREAEQNLYAPQGNVIYYDGERHLDRRRERARLALAWILWIPTTPLLPLLGLLPESWKQKLVHLGVDPGRASRASLMVEWFIVAVSVIAYVVSGGFLAGPVGIFTGAVALITASDIAYRMSADADNRAPGAFGIVGAVGRWVKELVKREQPLVDERERARIRRTIQEVERDTALGNAQLEATIAREREERARLAAPNKPSE